MQISDLEKIWGVINRHSVWADCNSPTRKNQQSAHTENRYFATWAVEDRMKRSAQLKSMMSPSLKVIRMHSDGVNGVEMYNRDKFIRFLLVFGQKRLESTGNNL